MAYDDDDDLYGEEFDFVDDDDEAPDDPSDVETEEKSEAKPRRGDSAPSRPQGRSRGPAKGPAKGPAAPRGGRNSRREPPRDERREPPRDERREPPRDEEPAPAAEPNSDREYGDRSLFDEEPVEERTPEPVGPPADHVIHIYEHGKFKRTIPRKFTDEEAVNFAEEFTRTGKAYGRYAIATPDDEDPAEEFADAAKG